MITYLSNFLTFPQIKVKAIFQMDKVNLQYGSLSEQEIKLTDLTYGDFSDENVFELWNLDTDQEKRMIIHDLKLNHVYRPSIKIFEDISDTQRLIHECEKEDFVCDFWTCNNNETIPASAVCNGTDFTGILTTKILYISSGTKG